MTRAEAQMGRAVEQFWFAALAVSDCWRALPTATGDVWDHTYPAAWPPFDDFINDLGDWLYAATHASRGEDAP